MGTTVVFGRLYNSPIHYPGKMTETIIRCKPHFIFQIGHPVSYVFSNGIKVGRGSFQNSDECSK